MAKKTDKKAPEPEVTEEETPQVDPEVAAPQPPSGTKKCPVCGSESKIVGSTPPHAKKGVVVIRCVSHGKHEV